ncbi:MAG: pantoate kinase, partial [Spirochaetia bacterium]
PGAQVSFSVIRQFEQLVQKELTNISVSHFIELPPGAGFGTSGAGAIGLSLALNRFCNLELSFEQCMHIAHIAEIECRTGLGTVIGEAYGGFEIRTHPGAPGVGKILHFQSENRKEYGIFCVYGPISTKASLSDKAKREAINSAGKNALKRMTEKPEVDTFLAESRYFSLQSGLVTEECRKTMDFFDTIGIDSGMLMFGNGVFTIVREPEVENLSRDLAKEFPDGQVFSSPIDSTGGRIIEQA